MNMYLSGLIPNSKSHFNPNPRLKSKKVGFLSFGFLMYSQHQIFNNKFLDLGFELPN